MFGVPLMATHYIRPRRTRDGTLRFQLNYRVGGRDTPLLSAGTFASLADAERAMDMVASQLAAAVKPRNQTRRDAMVYIAEIGGLLKIGISINPERRCASLHARLLHTEPGGREREREIHHEFRHLRVRGEFFRPGRGGEIRRYIRRAKKIAEIQGRAAA